MVTNGCAMFAIFGVLIVGIVAQFTLYVVSVPNSLAAAFSLMMVDQVSNFAIACLFFVLIDSMLKSWITYLAFRTSNHSDDLEKMGMLCAAFMKNATKTGSADVSYAEHNAANLEMTKSMTQLIKLETDKCKSGATKTESRAGSVDVSVAELNALKLKDEILPASESSSSCSNAHTLAD